MAGLIAGSVLALSAIGSGSALATDSRSFTVTVSNPTPASAGGVTKFDVTVQSTDNQTIANVKLSIPASGGTWPAGLTITGVFGQNASLCPPLNGAPLLGTSLSCDLGNIAAFGNRKISVLASIAATVPASDSVPTPPAITFSASAETNNENGTNKQVETGTSGALQVLAFSPNAITTFTLTGSVSTLGLGQTNAGNLQTTLNLLQDNGGNGNSINIIEGTSSTQPAVCVSLKLTCQLDFTVVTVNGGSTVNPYLETTLTANVPKTYSVKKAFVIHLKTDGSLDAGFPLYNVETTSCVAHPSLVPCADFSLSKTSVLTVVVHTTGNGSFRY